MRKSKHPGTEHLLDYYREFLREEDRMPRTREVARKFGATQSCAQFWINDLVDEGHLELRVNSPNNSHNWYRFPREK